MRLCIFKSTNHIEAQIIDDFNQKTIVSASSKENISYNPLNNLIRRMTGVREKADFNEAEKKSIEVSSNDELRNREEISSVRRNEDDEDRQAEIPAFLRRQAN